MSMTTIVTIVLVVVTLVLALVLIRTIFSSSTNAIDQVSNAIQDQINQLFTSGNENLIVYPTTNVITLSKGDTTPRGFAFSVKNSDPNPATFTWGVQATDVHNCGSATVAQVQQYLISSHGSFSLNGGDISSAQGSRVLLDTSSASPCTITFLLSVNETLQGSATSVPFNSQNVYVKIQ
ncbi:MAG: hypothetical protein KGH55_02890, partial [Nanoarchaeota archaeon]|nr:hypothetical protein [Nanoarchaeota archaeon]